MRIRRKSIVAVAGLAALALSACGGESPVVPTRTTPPFYNLQLVNNGSLPFFTWQGLTVREYMVQARLAPLSTGRPLDERFTGGRGDGGGGGGGPSRDTTVAVGQMSDVRWYNTSADPTWYRDSAVVDVMLKDTVFILTRFDPLPRLTTVDTGYLVNGLLVIRSVNRRDPNSANHRPMTLTYQIRSGS